MFDAFNSIDLKALPVDLTPTYDAVNNRFSVRYFLNLVLVDEEDRHSPERVSDSLT